MRYDQLNKKNQWVGRHANWENLRVKTERSLSKECNFNSPVNLKHMIIHMSFKVKFFRTGTERMYKLRMCTTTCRHETNGLDTQHFEMWAQVFVEVTNVAVGTWRWCECKRNISGDRDKTSSERIYFLSRTPAFPSHNDSDVILIEVLSFEKKIPVWPKLGVNDDIPLKKHCSKLQLCSNCVLDLKTCRPSKKLYDSTLLRLLTNMLL